MKLAVKWFAPITLVAMGLAWCCEQVALLLGFEPPPQDLVKIFIDPAVAWQIKAKYAAIAVLLAPVLEELVFRLGLFKLCCWCERKMRGTGNSINGDGAKEGFPIASAIASGAVFAAVHFHAATFLPLWFLGVAFAWLYWKSAAIASSMLCHFLFNLVNLILCLTIASATAG